MRADHPGDDPIWVPYTGSWVGLIARRSFW
jgi:hypothetical protein